ncbi:hypothetical protein [Halorhodospira neutriphila]|uniref:Uncharacterized protein n=1 Tax=Halorhodospira neutriphila TaxID=168379 RepID=A0ABS1E275_9GAMM|nr:hypothetical protein [Halorhodospira neutriphila]MBK1725570.1 hypothetical protein [Halorhodospira neutriphila]
MGKLFEPETYNEVYARRLYRREIERTLRHAQRLSPTPKTSDLLNEAEVEALEQLLRELS